MYPTFDTSKDYPTGRAPVVESIKLAGMPYARVSTTKYPDKLGPLAQATSGSANAYPYGPGPYWGPSKWRFPQDRPFVTCYNTTIDAHDIMAGRYPVYKPTLPDLIRERGVELNNTDYDKMKMVKVGDRTYSIDSIAHQPFEIAAAMFGAAGLNAANMAWPVGTTRKIETGGKLLLVPGERRRLPQDAFAAGCHGAVFLNPKGLRTAGGKDVERSVFYTSSEIAGMSYTVDKPRSCSSPRRISAIGPAR